MMSKEMGGIAAALERLIDLSEQASGVNQFERRRGVSVLTPNGVVQIPADPTPDAYELKSLESLGVAYIEYRTDMASVWHDNDRVVCLLDHDEPARASRLTLQLSATAAWGMIVKRGTGRQSQKLLLSLLNTTLRRQIRASESGQALQNALQMVRFQQSDEGENVVTRGKESMGRSLKAAVSGATELPEWITLKLRRWAELDHEREVEVRVDVNVDDQTFSLSVPDDEAAEAEIECQQWLGKQLRHECGCEKVFAGAPKS